MHNSFHDFRIEVAPHLNAVGIVHQSVEDARLEFRPNGHLAEKRATRGLAVATARPALGMASGITETDCLKELATGKLTRRATPKLRGCRCCAFPA